jgi:hypothetical protein
MAALVAKFWIDRLVRLRSRRGRCSCFTGRIGSVDGKVVLELVSIKCTVVIHIHV